MFHENFGDGGLNGCNGLIAVSPPAPVDGYARKYILDGGMLLHHLLQLLEHPQSHRAISFGVIRVLARLSRQSLRLVGVRILQGFEPVDFIAQLRLFKYQRITGRRRFHVRSIGCFSPDVAETVDAAVVILYLRDHPCLVLKELPAPRIVGLLGRIAENGDLETLRVAGVELVALADDPPFPLFKVAWSPRRINVMQSHKPLLDVRPCAHLGRTAHQEADVAAIDRFEQFILGGRRAVIVDERDFVRRHAALGQLLLDVVVNGVSVRAGDTHDVSDRYRFSIGANVDVVFGVVVVDGILGNVAVLFAPRHPYIARGRVVQLPGRFFERFGLRRRGPHESAAGGVVQRAQPFFLDDEKWKFLEVLQGVQGAAPRRDLVAFRVAHVYALLGRCHAAAARQRNRQITKYELCAFVRMPFVVKIHHPVDGQIDF